MAFHTERRQGILPIVFLLSILLSFLPAYAQSSEPAQTSSGGPQTGTIVSVRELRRAGFHSSRYTTPYEFTVDFALRISGQNYCTGYETPVLDEVQDLIASEGKEVRVDMRGKKLTVTLPSGRKIKAQLVKATQC